MSICWSCQEVPELFGLHTTSTTVAAAIQRSRHACCQNACRSRVVEQVAEGEDDEQAAEEAATAVAVSPSAQRYAYARPTRFTPGSCTSGDGDLSDSDSEGGGSFSSSPGSSLSAISLRSVQSMPGSPSKAVAEAATVAAEAAGRDGVGGGKEQPNHRHAGGGGGGGGFADGGMQRAATSRAAMSLRPLSPAGREISAHLRVRALLPAWMGVLWLLLRLLCISSHRSTKRPSKLVAA